MKNKIIAVILIALSLMLLLMSLCIGSAGGAGCTWGFPTYFTLHYNENIPNPAAWQTVFHHWNILISFSLISIPIFIAGYLWGKSNNKKSEPGVGVYAKDAQ